jgi:hypothetical protein
LDRHACIAGGSDQQVTQQRPLSDLRRPLRVAISLLRESGGFSFCLTARLNQGFAFTYSDQLCLSNGELSSSLLDDVTCRWK